MTVTHEFVHARRLARAPFLFLVPATLTSPSHTSPTHPSAVSRLDARSLPTRYFAIPCSACSLAPPCARVVSHTSAAVAKHTDIHIETRAQSSTDTGCLSIPWFSILPPPLISTHNALPVPLKCCRCCRRRLAAGQRRRRRAHGPLETASTPLDPEQAV